MVMVGVHVVAALAGVAIGVGAVYLGRVAVEGIRRDRRSRPELMAMGLRRDRWERAVEKMDSEDASERLECFAALERYGSEDPKAHEDIVELICSYLRRPFEYPVTDEAEFEVRLAAQRLLTRHLQEHSPREVWGAEELDLRDAVLVGPDFADCLLDGADFQDTVILGGDFRRARFFGDTDFTAAAFPGPASFAGAMFAGPTTFADAEFGDLVDFTEARVERPGDVHSWPSSWRVLTNSPVSQGRFVPRDTP